MTIIPIVIGAFGTVTIGLLKGLEDLEVGGRVVTIQNKSIIENGQNTEKCPGDLSWLAVTQSPVKDHQLTLMWKTLINNNNNIKRRISTWTLQENWKKLWNMKVTIIPIVVGAFGTVTKGLLKRLEDLDEWRRSKRQHYWEGSEYWEESRSLEGTCCHSNSSEKPSANADVKNSTGVNSNNK